MADRYAYLGPEGTFTEAALAAFDARFMPAVAGYVAKIDASPEFADEVRQVLGGAVLERRAGRLGAELDDDEEPEQERHRRDRELAPAVAHDFGLDLKQIGLDGDDPAQPPQQRPHRFLCLPSRKPQHVWS